MGFVRVGGWLCVLAAAAASPAWAQSAQLADACRAGSFAVNPEARDRCLDVVTAVEVLQPEAGILVAGANPVLGSAGALGTRAGLPRFSLGGRINAVLAQVPNVFDDVASEGKTLRFVVPLPQADLAVGVFSGVGLLPGVRGVGALDLLLSASVLPPVDELRDAKVAWGIGGRLGLLNESFARPGASVALLYRDVSRVQAGRLDDGDQAEFGTDLRVLSLRVTAGKSFLAIGVTAGVGWDRYRSDVDLRFVNPVTGAVETVFTRESPGTLETERWSGFGEFRLTFTVVSLVAQLGVLGRDARLLTDGATRVTSGGLFGGAGVRVQL